MARRPKSLTRSQLQARKDQAARFTRDVVGDAERAAEIESESLADYAARRHIEIQNPYERFSVPRKTIDDYRAELKDAKQQVRDLEEENESLQEQLDQISDIIAPEPEDEAKDDGEDADEDVEEDENPLLV